MRYAYKTIDRRETYYRNAAEVIAVDPLDFYTRAERGRAIQADLFDLQRKQYAAGQFPVSPDEAASNEDGC